MVKLGLKNATHLLYLVGVFLCVLVATYRTNRETSFLRW